MNQNLQQEIMALVLAAMSGDKKASQQIESIMKAAEQGNPQAAQIAQMIEQVAKQLQQQTVSAKLGSKLRYIKSIKAAKGCKMRKVRKHQVGQAIVRTLVPYGDAVYEFKNGNIGAGIGSALIDTAGLLTGAGWLYKAGKGASKLSKLNKAVDVVKAADKGSDAHKAAKVQAKSRYGEYQKAKQQRKNWGNVHLYGTGINMGRKAVSSPWSNNSREEYVVPDNLQVDPIIRRSDLGNDSATTDTTWRYIPQ